MSRTGYPDARPTSYGQGQGQRAGRRAGRTRAGQARQDTGITARQDTGRMGKAGQRAGRTGIVHGQDGRVIKWAGQQKAGRQFIQSGRLDNNGSAQSEIILSGHLDYPGV